jgi:predicted acyl esterase
MFNRIYIFLLLVFLSGAGVAMGEPASSFGQYQPEPLYSEAVTTSQYLTMRDGVRLASSITRPSQNGKPVEGRFPVLWQHTLSITARFSRTQHG